MLGGDADQGEVRGHGQARAVESALQAGEGVSL